MLDRDIYGYKIEVHYKGKSSYNTWLGLICTIIVYGIVFQSILVLGTAFLDFSRQEEKVRIEKFERHKSEPYNLAENAFKFYILPFSDQDDIIESLRPEIGSYWL